MDDHKKVPESFLRAIIGGLSGIVPALQTSNVVYSVVVVGVCGVVAELALPRIMSGLKGSSFKNLLGLFILTAISTAVAYEAYMRHDSSDYKLGQELIVTLPSYPTVAMRERPEFDRGLGEKITVLKVGQRVTYLAASPRKIFRFTRRGDGYNFLFAFWRKVKTKDGKVGWVYGQYLSEAK